MSDSLETMATPVPEENPLFIQVVQISDVGLVRSENQDFAMINSPELELSSAGKGRLMVVADGMGGHRGGARASQLAALTIKEAYAQEGEADIATGLRAAMERANAAIYHEAQTNPDLRGMGTTCSALVIRGRQAWLAHVGDSRIYLIRGGNITQLTEDHSLVASMVREGLLTSEEAEVHPRRNVLQRSMGVGESVEVDVIQSFGVQHGDTFILCSDGLHGLVKEGEMLGMIAQPIDTAARELVKRAIERGAPDNVTVIVARVEDPSVSGDGPVHESERTTMKLPAITEDPPKKSVLKRWLLFGLFALVAFGAVLYLGYRDLLESWLGISLANR